MAAPTAHGQAMGSGLATGVPSSLSANIGGGGPASSSRALSSSNSSASFRPKARVPRESLTRLAPGLQTVVEQSRVYGGLLSGPAQRTPPSTANLARLRAAQLMRERQIAMAAQRNAAMTRHSVAHVLVPGFQTPTSLARPVARADLDRRLSELSNRLNINGLQVSVNNGVAVVTGDAGSQSQKELVNSYLLLEPGIDDVDNRMTVPNPGL